MSLLAALPLLTGLGSPVGRVSGQYGQRYDDLISGAQWWHSGDEDAVSWSVVPGSGGSSGSVVSSYDVSGNMNPDVSGGGNRIIDILLTTGGTLTNVLGGTNGQKVEIRFKQNGSGNNAVGIDAGNFVIPTSSGLTTPLNDPDFLAPNATSVLLLEGRPDGKWNIVAYVPGYA